MIFNLLSLRTVTKQMNRFYESPVLFQWMIAVVLAALALVVLIYWNIWISSNALYYFILPLLVPILQFSISPIMKLTGVYKYLSPMLLVFSPSSKKYDLHNGTSFDYLFVMRGEAGGISFQNRILAFYLEGLLKIIEEVEQGLIPADITISGTSYFFSDSTAQRFGFTISPPSAFYKFNLYINYLDLIWMYSTAKGKLTFPKLSNIKAATTSGSILLEKKEYLEKMHLHLTRKAYDRKIAKLS